MAKAQRSDTVQNRFIIEILSTSDTLRITGNPEKPIFIDSTTFVKSLAFFIDSGKIDQSIGWNDLQPQILYNNHIEWGNLGLDLVYPVIYSKKQEQKLATYHENYSLPIAINDSQFILFRKWTTSEIFDRTLSITLWTKSDSSWIFDEYQFTTSSPVVNCVDCQTIDCYIDRLNEPCFGMGKELCYDTTNRILTYVEIITVSYESKCIPSNYVVYQKKLDPKYYQLLVLNGNDSTEILNGLRVPPNCEEYFETCKYPQSSEYISCYNDFYSNQNDSVAVDTIYTTSDYEFHNYQNIIWECQYFFQLKNGFEIGYYSLSELSGYCRKDNGIVKYEGEWKMGKKIGKWKYYNKEGVLVKTEIYKKGVLKKTVPNK